MKAGKRRQRQPKAGRSSEKQGRGKQGRKAKKQGEVKRSKKQQKRSKKLSKWRRGTQTHTTPLRQWKVIKAVTHSEKKGKDQTSRKTSKQKRG